LSLPTPTLMSTSTLPVDFYEDDAPTSFRKPVPSFLGV
jgi:hypothetical protein